MKRLLPVCLLFLLGLLMTPVPVSATVYGYDFEPKSGGPGTLVTVHGLVPRTEIVVVLGRGTDPLSFSSPGFWSGFQEKLVLGKVMPDLSKGCCEVPFSTTVRIPAYWPDGSAITESNLAIIIRDNNGEQIRQTEIRAFTFTPGPLPATGDNEYIGVMAALAASLITIFAGLMIKRRLDSVEA